MLTIRPACATITMHSASMSSAHLNAQFRSAHSLLCIGNSRTTARTASTSAHKAQQTASSTAERTEPLRDVEDCRICEPSASDGISCSRRMLVGGAAALFGASLLPAPPAQAALVQFPCAELNNKYILIRAGESYSESQDTILTNPAWKTSMAAGLSEKGKAQVWHGHTTQKAVH